MAMKGSRDDYSLRESGTTSIFKKVGISTLDYTAPNGRGKGINRGEQMCQAVSKGRSGGARSTLSSFVSICYRFVCVASP